MKSFTLPLLSILLFYLASCSSSDNQSANDVSENHEVEKESTQLEVDYNFQFETDLEEGKSLYTTCIACHGELAQGMNALNAPSLVNQSDWYLKRQLVNFKQGIRGAHQDDVYGQQMIPMAKILPDNKAIHNVVAYIMTLEASKTEKTIDGDISNGETIYNMLCGACHGPGALGNEALHSPALVGVDDWYLSHQLENFQKGIRGSHDIDKYGKQMVPMAKSLDNKEAIHDVVRYIQSLQDEE